MNKQVWHVVVKKGCPKIDNNGPFWRGSDQSEGGEGEVLKASEVYDPLNMMTHF